jgi:two-component system, cell cycle sensor histidine kinase and response regulator CckA
MAVHQLPRAGGEAQRQERLTGTVFYVLAVVGTAAAYGLEKALPGVFARLPFAPYFIIGGVLTLFGGRGPGLLMVALFAGVWILEPPVGPWATVGAIAVALPTIWFIDRHRHAVAALRTSERRYAHLCELSSDIVLTDDLDGRIVSISDAGARLGGYSPADILGRESLEFLVPADRDRAREARRKLLNGERGEMVSLEVGVVKADGTVLAADVRSGLAMSGGRVVGFHTLARDVTERRRLQLQLQQSQKLEAIGRLAGGVAHDFNNLLTAIRGFVDLAEEDLPAGHPAASDLAEARRCCNQAADIVGQLLAFGRRQSLAPQVLVANDALAGLEPMLRRLVGPRITLETRYVADAGRIHVDPHQLTQVLMNLAVNARDAMPHGGTLTIGTTVEVVTPLSPEREGVRLEEGRYVVISVEDTGTGIEPATLAHIFEPFFTTKGEAEGSGLGLATVYGIVKQSGGYIWVDSHVGEGTRFEVHLPGDQG